MKRTLALALLLAAGLALSPTTETCRAQTTPFLSDEEIRTLSNEISGDRAYEHIRWLTHWHRDSGIKGFFKARDYVMQAAREAGADALTGAERAAAKRVPANAPTLEAYFANRARVPASASGRLHGLMRAEVFNFVDGRRSYYDIYKAAYAEAAAGGSWYYGTVALEDVVGLLDAAVAAGALTLK